MFINRRIKNFIIRKQGQAIVETALVIPIMLLMLFGIIDFGRVLFTWQQLSNINQRAVRMSGLGSSDSEVISYVKSNLVAVDTSELDIQISPNDSNRTSGGYVTMNTYYTIKYITPLMNQILSSVSRIHVKSEMLVQ